MGNNNAITTNQRYHTLDTLRGIACLQVVIGHCFLSIKSLEWIYWQHASDNLSRNWAFFLAYSPLHFFLSGTKAVIVFFILSGFVLSIPLYKKDITKGKYFVFFNKRILRLYLPCLAIILISLLVKNTYYNAQNANNYGYFVKGILSLDFTGMNLIKSIFLFPPYANLNTVLWTLPIEIKLSLILPFFVYILKRSNLIGSVIMIVAMVFVNIILKKIGAYGVLSDLSMLYYMTFFLIGSVLCKYRLYLLNMVDNLNTSFYYSILIVSLYFYTFEYSMWWLPSKALSVLLHYTDYVSAVCGIVFLLFALSKRLETFFNTRFLEFLGKISFSLYLTHCIVILSCVYLLNDVLNQYLLVFVGFMLSFPFAYLFYKFVEIPSLKLANNFADKLSGLILIKDDIKPELFDSSKTQ